VALLHHVDLTRLRVAYWAIRPQAAPGGGQGDVDLSELRERLAKFGLDLHPDKTRLIEFGRHAAWTRAKRGLGKPETFDFLGFTHICAKSKTGRFWLKRVTIAKRMRAKLRQVNDQLKRRRHEPVPVQGQWLRSVVQGHLAYYPCPATPTRWRPSVPRRRGTGSRRCGVVASAHG